MACMEYYSHGQLHACFMTELEVKHLGFIVRFDPATYRYSSGFCQVIQAVVVMLFI
jgi:hypothetical protein